eukprot:TRINITY_DN3521_c0_g2_i1.p1 TRINITY_DN3521_c0_g2~~TRINITY_DN3521_c0_g2_i1.p1  ORF type:complete len:570 (-),score=80.85 TRINITY_DN3521_c0_g2_i1:60-1769(-)
MKQKIVSKLTLLDFFSKPFTLLANKRQTFKTPLGGVLFFMITVLSMYSFCYYLIKMIQHTEVNIARDSVYSNLVGKYELNKNNFLFAFSLKKDDTIYTNESKYFKINLHQMRYTRNLSTSEIKKEAFEVKLEQCDKSLFTGLFDQDFKYLRPDLKMLCPVNLTYSLAGQYLDDEYDFIRVTVTRCVNSTNDKVVCASPEEITNNTKNLQLEIYFRDHSAKPQNPDSPFNVFLNQLYITMDNVLTRKTDVFMRRTQVISDYNVITSGELKAEEALSFSTKDTQLTQIENNILSSTFFRLSQNTDKIYRKFWKLPDVLARTIGILQSAMILGSLIAVFYSKFRFYEWLINSTFEFRPHQPPSQQYNPTNRTEIKELISISASPEGASDRNRGPSTKSRQQQKSVFMRYSSYHHKKDDDEEEADPRPKELVLHKKTLNFGFISFLLPCINRVKRSLFTRAKEKVNNYMDIRFIIEKLQEIDKLKQILLTKEQMLMMKFIPKPEITERVTSRAIAYDIQENEYDKPLQWITEEKTDQIIKSYQRIRQEITTDQVNKRLLEIIDPELKEMLDES